MELLSRGTVYVQIIVIIYNLILFYIVAWRVRSVVRFFSIVLYVYDFKVDSKVYRQCIVSHSAINRIRKAQTFPDLKNTSKILKYITIINLTNYSLHE